MRDGDGSLPESVPEPAPDGLEVSHAAGAGHLSADRLLGPVVLAHTGSGESARRAEMIIYDLISMNLKRIAAPEETEVNNP